ncbi:hypothetical protein GCM10027275_21340 [Rhabdobacter roseus]|uniref:exo-alpha-sialidase n=1 Tax=Rhabdobacter roseus TaxID=1655419 RepID=A0A840TWP9_9BACT|nr:twin-arginine translocation signal domain-containing protein [Rhabdobacter roseus]MBB5284069.1 hypothetical protein [Rhabdobacter roseus]
MVFSRRDFIKVSTAVAGAGILGGAVRPASGKAPSLPRTGLNGMRILASGQRFTVADQPSVYYHSTGVVSTPEGLLCVYRSSDHHLASWSNVCAARSRDGGRTWEDHRILATSSFEQDAANWVSPQLSKLPDGRLVIIVDQGKKKTPFDWPMLSNWQKPDRGMSNWLLESTDHGKSWQPLRCIDQVGGEPSYITALSNGTLLYTRTDSAETTLKKNPALPWGTTYYRSTLVFSDDGGRSWKRTVRLFDDPFIGDCEVGVVEFAPGKLLALSRVGDGGSAFGQPSRMVFSEDFGKTWGKPLLAPCYAQRPCLGTLRHKAHTTDAVFATFRNSSHATPGTLAWTFDPTSTFAYEPNNFIWREENCLLKTDGLHIRTGEGTDQGVEYQLYPMEDDDSACEMEVTLAVKEADTHGCNLSVGAWIRFEPRRVSLADRPELGFDWDTTEFHTYRIINENQRIRVFVNGQLKLDEPLEGLFTRYVRFGNRRGATPNPDLAQRFPENGYFRNRSHSIWKTARVHVRNRRDHAVRWSWEARSGKYPDQFRRDNFIMLEKNASYIASDSGYSGWAQADEGTLVISDYTCGEEGLKKPLVRAYRLPIAAI